MKTIWKLANGLSILLVVLLAACDAPMPTPTNLPATSTPITPTATVTVTPIPPTPTATPTITPSPTTTSTPTPTATPTVLKPARLTFEHPMMLQPTTTIRDRITPWQFPFDASDEAATNQLIVPRRATPTQFTRAQAEQDVRFFFNLLKHGYAGYGVFGGSDAFGRAENSALQELARETSHSPTRLGIILRNSLTFIQDCHLNIDGKNLFKDSGYFYYDRFNFFQEGERFYYWGANGKTFVEAINGKPPREYMKLSLNKEGDPVYHFGLIATSYPGELTWDTVTADGKRQKQTGLWDRSPLMNDRTTFARYQEQDISVVVSRSFSGDTSALRKFEQDAENLRIEPMVIVDLRGNSGGLVSVPAQWITGLTWRTPAFPFVRAEIESRTVTAGKINNFSDLVNFQNALHDWDTGKKQPGWSNIQVPQPAPFQWHQLMIVLMDNQTASAGEVMIGYLRQFQHVVLVGENSTGCITFGDVSQYTLPNSNLSVRFGSELFIPPDLAEFEGKGYAPDLWAPSNRALEYTIAAIKKGWLKPPP